MALLCQGKKIASGLGMGRAKVIEKICWNIPNDQPDDFEQEIIKFRQCCDNVAQKMQEMIQETQKRMGKRNADILDAQLTLLQDEYSVLQPVEDMIRREGVNMVQAIHSVLGDISESFRQAEDEYIQLRASDAEDVQKRLLMEALKIQPKDYSVLPENTILVAEELTPSDTMRMDLSHVSGIITSEGGYYSHVGIISRNLGIPSVCGVPEAVKQINGGELILVDGDEGIVILSPEDTDLERFREKSRAKAVEIQKLEAFRTLSSRTLDGEHGLICANIGTAEEVELALSSGAEGIGLMRSEFLYMDQTELPDEEEQFLAYRNVLEKMDGRPVIVRTLDAGGDKVLPSLHMRREENPFLGCRAIRLCLTERELFHTQLRALLRASVYGNLKIMFPMISTLEELRSAKSILETARKELIQEKTSVSKVSVGIMIEVPAAALMSDCLAQEVDFFSIGTNDLIQYTMAAERGNQDVDYLYSPYDPAVLRLIAMTAQAAERAEIMCGMCGEAAADPNLIPVFWGMGLRELSMSANSIPRGRSVLAQWETKDCRKLAKKVLECSDRQEVQTLIQAEQMSRNSVLPEKRSSSFS